MLTELYSWMKLLLLPVDTFFKNELVTWHELQLTHFAPNHYSKLPQAFSETLCTILWCQTWTYNDFRLGFHWFTVIYPTALSLYSYHLLTVGHWTSTGLLRKQEQDGWVSITEPYFILKKQREIQNFCCKICLKSAYI